MFGKRVVFVLNVLLLSALACLAGGTTPQGEEEKPGISPIPEAPTEALASQGLEAVIESSQASTTAEGQGDILPASGPNLELYPTHTAREPLGNGLDRYMVWLVLKNASSGWHSYSFVGLLGGSYVGQVTSGCLWAASMQPTFPVLFTKEGGQYEAKTDTYESCGPRWVPTIPPGLFVSGMGETLSTASAFGWVTFEIPEGATPERVEFWYGQTVRPGIEEMQEAVQSIVMALDSTYSGSVPIDESFGERIYKVGEVIPIGEFAEVSFASAGTTSDGTLSVTLTIVSKDALYPVEPMYLSHTALVNQSGVICCGVRLTYDSFSSTWGAEEPIGPNQTRTYSVVFENLNRDHVWLFGQIRLQEVSQAKSQADASFVVELP